MLQFSRSSFYLMLYLLPVFIVNVDLGPTGEFFLRGQFLLYPLLIILFSYKEADLNILKPFLVLELLFSIYGVGYSFFGGQEYILDSFIGAQIFLMYFLATYVILRSVEAPIIIDAFDKIVLILIVMVFISTVIWKFTGLYFLADDGYGYFRPHALLSEPSALTPFLAYGLSSFLLKADYIRAMLVLIAILMVGSIIAIFVSLVVLILAYIYHFNIFKKIVLLILSLVALVFFYEYVINFDSIGGSVFDSQMARLRQALLSFESLGESGYNPRVATTMDMLGYSAEKSVGLWFGFGPLSDKFLPFSMIAHSAPSLPLLLFFNFGLIAVVVFVIWLFYGLITRDVKNKTNLLFVCLGVSSLVNSAQGLLIYQLVFLLGFLPKGAKNEIPSS